MSWHSSLQFLCRSSSFLTVSVLWPCQSWYGHLVGHIDSLPCTWMSQNHLCHFSSASGTFACYWAFLTIIAEQQSQTNAQMDFLACLGICLCRFYIAKHNVLFRMPLVINLLQSIQECRFHEPRMCEVAPIEIKAKTFTGDVKHRC